MGSESDWETLRHASNMLFDLQILHDVHVLSAHRTPERMLQFAEHAEEAGYRLIIAGAGGAAHLPGMIASATLLPVIGVPVQSAALHGLDSLLSIVQMPGGVPVATMAIGKAGAVNAALYAARILASTDPTLKARLDQYRQKMRETVLDQDRTVKSWMKE
ncbi:MAG: 5-(carboxyamino)imidazole ribonucleotide mutase [Sulfobacillus acidophilus]|uniref:N5-carboxyaminoimidazole ribonucleotide mutase n=1 Tax=Sulfobacillus acidophilus TaxID=53633 RepID=A0A2T2WPL7_9FIRM|nr:MAG: 5-(carboxyamino)imidazole ribonucleotide mutase [Sulfobacillus acidophilus]